MRAAVCHCICVRMHVKVRWRQTKPTSMERMCERVECNCRCRALCFIGKHASLSYSAADGSYECLCVSVTLLDVFVCATVSVASLPLLCEKTNIYYDCDCDCEHWELYNGRSAVVANARDSLQSIYRQRQLLRFLFTHSTNVFWCGPSPMLTNAICANTRKKEQFSSDDD